MFHCAKHRRFCPDDILNLIVESDLWTALTASAANVFSVRNGGHRGQQELVISLLFSEQTVFCTFQRIAHMLHALQGSTDLFLRQRDMLGRTASYLLLYQRDALGHISRRFGNAG